MVKSYLRQQALAHHAVESVDPEVLQRVGLQLWVETPRIQFAIRGDADDQDFVAGIKKISGLTLPVKANTVSSNAEASLLWMGPDEWLYSQIESSTSTELEAEFNTALAAQHCLISDVSNSRIVLGLSGTNAREILMKAISLDIHPNVFSPGQCAQSSFARCHVLLHQINDDPCYHLYFHRSFSDYAYRWILDATNSLTPVA